MSNFAIQVQDIAKRYRIGKAPAQNGKISFLKKLASPFSYLASTFREPEPDELIWALRGVSFSVDQGEVIGVVGRNGAGKSTLLKILARITEPTQGKVFINGRVGSLLEVGTGFHPELTGRENIYLNGTILGMKRYEIDRKFDEIVAFAETAKFLDTPVKRYSSGMYVRLAFAVAAHLEPEILLVDEVLAVGDLAFQKKCLGKMGDVAKEGRTVLFVSHNMIAVQNLCTRAVWLDNGQLKDEGDTNQVINNYLATSYKAVTEQVWNDSASAPGNDRVRIHKISLRPVNGAPGDQITMETPFEVEVQYWNLLQDARLHISLHFYNEQQIVAFTANSNESDPVTRDQELSPGLYRSTCHVPGNLLNAGVHRIMLLMLRDTSKITHRMEDALQFEVFEINSRPGTWYGKEPGVVHPTLNWNTEFVDKMD